MLSRSVPDEPTCHFPIEESPADKTRPAPFVIGVCGGTASGKTSICEAIMDQLRHAAGRVVILSQDSYYKGLSAESLKHVSDYNFDHPDAFDWELIEQHLSLLKRRKPIEVPTYDFVTHARTSETTHVYGADVILFEGILAFSERGVRDLMDMKLFVDTDADTRLIRRIRRDIKDRGRSLEGILIQYERFVKPSFDQYIAPTKKFADVVIPRGQSNTVAIELIVRHILAQLAQHHTKKIAAQTPKKR